MSYCHVSRQCDDHAYGEMVFDALQQKITARVNELTKKGAEFYPYSTDNVLEVFGHLTNDQTKILVHALESGVNEIGLILAGWIENYWIEQAERKAIKELS